jgi:hypothetical protein
LLGTVDAYRAGMITTKSLASILRAVGAALVLSAAGCASSAAIRTGGVAYAPLPSDAPVAVYFDERAIGRPFEIVGEVEVDNPGKYQILTVNDAVPELSARARSLGANAIIIDSSAPVKSGIISTGVYARARAVRVLDAAPAVPVARTDVAPQGR